MAALQFKIDNAVLDRFLELQVHAVRVTGLLSVIPQLNDEALLREAMSQLNQKSIDVEKLSEYLPISAWREAYGKMNVKPSRFRSSIEALLRRALKGSSIVLPIPAVNFYNALSIINIAPMGACDASKLTDNNLVMRFADPDSDIFEPLGAETSDFPLNKDLVVYSCKSNILCWGFNCRDSKKFALDSKSDDAIFFSEAALGLQTENTQKALEDLRTRMLSLGAICSEHMLAKAGSPSFEI